MQSKPIPEQLELALEEIHSPEIRDQMERERGGKWRDSPFLMDGEIVIRDPRFV